MAKNKISEWSATAANNTDIGGIDIAEGCAPSGINNAIRELMAQVKDQQTGTDADNFTVGGNLSVTGTTTATGAITATGGVTGNVTGNLTGNVTGNVTGATTGAHNGSVGATTPSTGVFTTASASSGFTGNVTGNLTGNVTGNVTGSSGSCTGNAATATYAPLISDTTVASTSGTSVTFTGIPSWVKRITVMLNGVSTSGTSIMLCQIGSGSFTTSGYISAAWSANTSSTTGSTGFNLVGVGVAAGIFSGVIQLVSLGSNAWCQQSNLGSQNSGNSISTGAGSVAIGGNLDRIRITTVNGTDTFDAGSINIIYE
jgi:hypothetical protein